MCENCNCKYHHQSQNDVYAHRVFLFVTLVCIIVISVAFLYEMGERQSRSDGADEPSTYSISV